MKIERAWILFKCILLIDVFLVMHCLLIIEKRDIKTRPKEKNASPLLS